MSNCQEEEDGDGPHPLEAETPPLLHPSHFLCPTSFRKACLVCHIHHLLCNELPLNSVAETSKNKNKLITQVLGS